jgi:mercuric ion transport protein
LVCLGAGYWFTRRASQVACAEGMACACPRPNRIVTIALAAATVLVITAFAFDYVAYLL